MDWESINQFNVIIGIINGVWGIGNIIVTIKSYLTTKEKKDFLFQLDEERKHAEKEHSKVCRKCKASTQQTIDILKEMNKVPEKV